MAYFVKYLTKVDVEKQMAIPTNFIEHLPRYQGGETIYFPVHDVSGKIWESIGYYIRKAGQRYPKPRGWRKYVHAKRLTPGDKIITIAAKRKIKLFGKTIGWSEEF